MAGKINVLLMLVAKARNPPKLITARNNAKKARFLIDILRIPISNYAFAAQLIGVG
jgi:hypothetical protein